MAPSEAPDVPPEHVLLSSSGRGWSGVDAAEIHHPKTTSERPTSRATCSLSTSAAPSTPRKGFEGRRGIYGSGDIVVLPAGAPHEWHLERRGEVGFASPSHFAQQFRRLVGVSPRSFR